MFIVISRKPFFNTTLAMVGILSLSLITIAVHPHLYQWRKEGVVISYVKTDKKAVALTFDDGPQPNITPQLLNILEHHHARATFFVLGIQAEKYPAIVKETHAKGHEIGNHGYSHQISRYRNLHYAIDDIEKTSRIIAEITGHPPMLLRPPGGFLSDDLVNYTRQKHIKIITWSWEQDSKDWGNNSSRQIASHIIKNLRPGQIIILHDGGSRRNEVLEAVDLLLTEMTRQGYKAVTVSELISLAN